MPTIATALLRCPSSGQPRLPRSCSRAMCHCCPTLTSPVDSPGIQASSQSLPPGSATAAPGLLPQAKESVLLDLRTALVAGASRPSARAAPLCGPGDLACCCCWCQWTCFHQP
eukprot:362861-Chlamydomonas_euryale.AAC.3